MKCDKHGTEMEWRGSLMKGGMHCDGCELDKAGEMYGGSQFDKAMLDAVVTGTGFMGIDPADLQQSFTVAGGRIAGKSAAAKADALAKQYVAPPPPTRHVGRAPASSVAHAKARINAADMMCNAIMSGKGSAYCPYCLTTVGPAHVGAHSYRLDPEGDLCFKAYSRDCDVVARGRI